MLIKNKQNLVGVFSIGIIVITAFQAYIPQLPLTELATTVFSTVLMYLGSVFTVWKQYLSEQIDNKALGPTIFVALIATVGGLTQLLDLAPISAHPILAQWSRFGITFITMVLNLVSKIKWPTPATKSLI